MTMITLDTHIETEHHLLADMRKALAAMRAEIDGYTEALACGDPEDLAQNCPEVKKLAGLYMACMETENRLAKCRETKAGIAQNGVAFDLDAARASIGGTLDRLRAACSPGVVPGGDG